MFSRDGSLLPSSYADARYIDAVIASKGSARTASGTARRKTSPEPAPPSRQKARARALTTTQTLPSLTTDLSPGKLPCRRWVCCRAACCVFCVLHVLCVVCCVLHVLCVVCCMLRVADTEDTVGAARGRRRRASSSTPSSRQKGLGGEAWNEAPRRRLLRTARC